MSIPANIVEGTAKGSAPDFCRFLSIAAGSASELEYHLLLAKDTKIIPISEFESLVSQTVAVRKMLCGLIAKLKSPKVRPSDASEVSV